MPLPVPDISRNLFDLSGDCSIDTGVGQGIGLALAEALAHAGSDVVLTERHAEHLEAGASRIEAIGHGQLVVVAGVRLHQDGGGVDHCSSKAALQSLTRAAAQDVAAKGVRVNAIAPGAVDTPMHADHRAKLFEYERYIPLGRCRSRRIWPGRRSSSPRTPAATSPARRCTSTAA